MHKIKWVSTRQGQKKKKDLPKGLFGLNLENEVIDEPAVFYPLIDGLETNEHSKEKLISLLKLASEVEHRLMIQYLFTMFSISDDNENEVIELKTAVLRPIAIQEMGHLLAVQNLLLAVGGIEELHLHKDIYLPSSQDNPLPFSMESFSFELLAEFVAVEAPQVIPKDKEEQMKVIREIAEQHAGGQIKSVGGVYERIFWLMQPSDEPVQNKELMQLSVKPGLLLAGDHIKDDDFRSIAEIEKYEAFRELWNNGGTVITQMGITLDKVHNRDHALSLINQIAEQGEGFDFNFNDSHFENFYNAYEKLKGSAVNVYNLPKNLSVKPDPALPHLTVIQNNYSILWAVLFNECYTSLLLDIYSSFLYKQVSERASAIIGKLVYVSMNVILKGLSMILFKLPLLDDGYKFNVEPRCGPTFEISSHFEISSDLTKITEQHIRYQQSINDLLAKIKAHAYYEGHITDDFDAFALTDTIEKYLENKIAVLNNQPII